MRVYMHLRLRNLAFILQARGQGGFPPGEHWLSTVVQKHLLFAVLGWRIGDRTRQGTECEYLWRKCHHRFVFNSSDIGEHWTKWCNVTIYCCIRTRQFRIFLFIGWPWNLLFNLSRVRSKNFCRGVTLVLHELKSLSVL